MKLSFTSSTSLFRFALAKFFSGTLPYLIVTMVFVFLCPQELWRTPDPFFLGLIVALFIFVLLRMAFWLKNRKLLRAAYEEAFKYRQASLQRQFVVLGLLGAVLWSWLGIVTIQNIGAFRTESIFVYICLSAVAGGGGQTFGSNRKLWLLNIVLLIIVPGVFSWWISPNRQDLPLIGCLLAANILYVMGVESNRWIRNILLEGDDQRQQLDHLRSVIESIPGLVTIFDHELKYRLISSRLSNFMGVRESDFIGQPLGFMKSEEFTEAVTTFSQSTSDHFQLKMQIRGAEETRWFFITMTHLPRFAQVIVVSIDIEDQVRAEKVATDQRAMTEASARLAAIGELAAGIAHEINNPLAVITGKAEQTLRLAKSKNAEEFYPALEKIHSTGMRIAKIIRGLRNLSRSGANDSMSETNLLNAVLEVTAVFESKLKAHQIRLEVNIPEDVNVVCLPAQLSQILLNLLTNSFDELKDKTDAWVRVSYQATELWHELSVTDSGTGIPVELQSKIMTPFFTTKPAGRGTGLGLSISKRLALAQGGNLILNEKSPNTCFVLRLPLHSIATGPSTS